MVAEVPAYGPYLPYALTVAASVVVSLFTVWATKQTDKKKTDTQLTLAELSDQERFRAQLMEQIAALTKRQERLEGDLAECKSSHEEAKLENTRLLIRIQSLEQQIMVYRSAQEAGEGL